MKSGARAPGGRTTRLCITSTSVFGRWNVDVRATRFKRFRTDLLLSRNDVGWVVVCMLHKNIKLSGDVRIAPDRPDAGFGQTPKTVTTKDQNGCRGIVHLLNVMVGWVERENTTNPF